MRPTRLFHQLAGVQASLPFGKPVKLLGIEYFCTFGGALVTRPGGVCMCVELPTAPIPLTTDIRVRLHSEPEEEWVRSTYVDLDVTYGLFKEGKDYIVDGRICWLANMSFSVPRLQFSWAVDNWEDRFRRKHMDKER